MLQGGRCRATPSLTPRAGPRPLTPTQGQALPDAHGRAWERLPSPSFQKDAGNNQDILNLAIKQTPDPEMRLNSAEFVTCLALDERQCFRCRVGKRFEPNTRGWTQRPGLARRRGHSRTRSGHMTQSRPLSFAYVFTISSLLISTKTPLMAISFLKTFDILCVYT